MPRRVVDDTRLSKAPMSRPQVSSGADRGEVLWTGPALGYLGGDPRDVATTRDQLPPLLPGLFTVARARELGVGEGRLRKADLGRPCRGTRSRVLVPDLTERLRALSLVLPDGAVFSHDTAARLLGLPLPLGGTWPTPEHDQVVQNPVVHVLTPPGSPRVVRSGVVGHRGTPSEIVTVKGLRVVGPASALVDLAGTWTLEDLVAAGDMILTRWSARSSGVVGDGPGELTRVVDAAVNRRGVRTLRRALPLMRVGARSPMESRARLIMVRGGLPEPELNVEVHDPRTGEWLATPDFLWRNARVIAEFQGDHHRTDRAQWQSDIVRLRGLQEADWRVVPLTADDVLRHPDRLLGAVRRALSL